MRERKSLLKRGQAEKTDLRAKMMREDGYGLSEMKLSPG